MMRSYHIGLLDFFFFSFVESLVAQVSFPISEGMLAFHSYTDYDAWDGKLFMFDFADSTLIELSKNWNIDHPLNAHFSPSGRLLTFMGDERGEPRDWDIFLWEIRSSAQPFNLTRNYGTRDEDPKFSPDGQKIVFKQSYWDHGCICYRHDLKEMDLSGNIISIITHENKDEESMPFYSRDGSSIIYSKGAGASADIYKIDLNNRLEAPLVQTSDIQDYYPITRDENSFLFSRWYSMANRHDQIYMGYFAGDTPLFLPINEPSAENADPYPAGADHLFFSSDRHRGAGDYDLYVGNIRTGQVWSLDIFRINSSRKELGAAYFHAADSRIVEPTSAEPSISSVRLSTFPNPFNTSTRIAYSLLRSERVLLSVYDVYGRQKQVLVDEVQLAGGHTTFWTPKNLPSGLYWLTMILEDNRLVVKCALIK